MNRAFFLGPDKAGSSWLQVVADDHPEVAVPTAKDLYFFDRYYSRGLEWYERQFPVHASTLVALEVCHDYLYSRAAAERIATHYPDALLTVSVRHPIERAVSAYHYMVRQGRLTVSFERALVEEPELLEHGRYGAHLEGYLTHFDASQVLVQDFAAIKHSGLAYANRLWRFLGVSEAAQLPQRATAAVRPASRARLPLLATCGRRVGSWLRDARGEVLVTRIKNSPLVERLLFRSLSTSERTTPTERDRAFAEERIRSDATRLDELFGTTFERAWWG